MSKTVNEAPAKIRELNTHAQRALDKGNLEYAIDLYLQMLTFEPELHEIRRKLRDTQVELAAKKKVNHSVSSMKGMGKMMAMKGQLKKNPAKALVLAEDLLKLDLFNESFLLAYCDAAVAAQLPIVGAIALEAVTKVNKKSPVLLERLGALQMAAGNSAGARRAYELLGDLRPGDQKVIKQIKDAAAMTTISDGRWEEEGSFRKSLKNESEAVELEQENRARLTDSDLERMIRTQRMNIQREPENINYYRPLADNLLRAELFEEALEVLHKADDLAKGADPMVRNAISHATLAAYDYNIRIMRENGDLEAMEEQKRERAAFVLQDAKEKVMHYPNDLSFKFDYGVCLYDNGEIDQAIAQFQQSQRNPKLRTESLYRLGICFKKKGLYDIAESQFKTAASELLSLDKTKMNILYELGEVLELQGKRDQALGYYKQIFTEDIGFRDVAKKIEAGYSGPSNPA